MDESKIKEAIAYWTEQLEYHLGNHRRAIEVGAHNSEDDNRERAAQAASILTALKGLLP